jgi:hypothetical protein
VSFKEYGLQDANTLEATQTMVESRVLDEFRAVRPGGAHPPPAQGDRGLGGRLPAQDGGSVTSDDRTMLPPEFADPGAFSDWCLPTEAERYAKRLASSMQEMQAFYDAITRAAEEAIAYCDKFPLDDMPEDVLNLMHLLYSMIMVSFPVECWKQPRCPTPVPPRWTACPNRSRDRTVVCGAARWADVDAARCAHRAWSCRREPDPGGQSR